MIKFATRAHLWRNVRVITKQKMLVRGAKQTFSIGADDRQMQTGLAHRGLIGFNCEDLSFDVWRALPSFFLARNE